MLVATQGNTARTTQPSRTGPGTTSFKPGTLTGSQRSPNRTPSPMPWPSATVAGCNEVSSTWAGVQALPACLSTHLSLAPHDEHGAVGHRHPLERFGLYRARWHPDPGPMSLPSGGVL